LTSHTRGIEDGGQRKNFSGKHSFNYYAEKLDFFTEIMYNVIYRCRLGMQFELRFLFHIAQLLDISMIINVCPAG
jgi:hypothetical protein